jgi:hypothetical protein
MMGFASLYPFYASCPDLPPTTAPGGPDQPKHEPDKQDRGRDLDPKETTEFTQDNFGLSAPITRKRIADSFNAVRAGSQGPSDPLRLVKKRSAEQNPSQQSSADSEGVHLGVVLERHEPSIFSGLSHVIFLFEAYGAGEFVGWVQRKPMEDMEDLLDDET